MAARRNEPERLRSVQSALAAEAPKPTPDFRRRAWAVFQAALGRYLRRPRR